MMLSLLLGVLYSIFDCFTFPAMVRGPLKNLWVSVACADDSAVRFAIARLSAFDGALRPWRSAISISDTLVLHEAMTSQLSLKTARNTNPYYRWEKLHPAAPAKPMLN